MGEIYSNNSRKTQSRSTLIFYTWSVRNIWLADRMATALWYSRGIILTVNNGCQRIRTIRSASIAGELVFVRDILRTPWVIVGSFFQVCCEKPRWLPCSADKGAEDGATALGRSPRPI